jgi:hypothetical protein
MEVVRSDVNERLPAFRAMMDAFKASQAAGLLNGVPQHIIDGATSTEPAGIDYQGNLVVHNPSVPAALMLLPSDHAMDARKAFNQQAQLHGVQSTVSGYSGTAYYEKFKPTDTKAESFSYAAVDSTGTSLVAIPTVISIASDVKDPVEFAPILAHEIAHQQYDRLRSVPSMDEAELWNDKANALTEKLAYGGVNFVIACQRYGKSVTELPVRVLSQVPRQTLTCQPEEVADGITVALEELRVAPLLRGAVLVKALQNLYGSSDSSIATSEVRGYLAVGVTHRYVPR